MLYEIYHRKCCSVSSTISEPSLIEGLYCMEFIIWNVAALLIFILEPTYYGELLDWSYVQNCCIIFSNKSGA